MSQGSDSQPRDQKLHVLVAEPARYPREVNIFSGMVDRIRQNSNDYKLNDAA